MIPNPNAPDEYKYETDYRKIPRKYLNPKSLKGVEKSNGNLLRLSQNSLKF